MPTEAGEVTVFRPGELLAMPFGSNLPVRLDPGVMLVVNASPKAVWVDPGHWNGIPVIVGKRTPARSPRVATVMVKAGAIFAAGFSVALLYSAEPTDRYVIRMMLPPPGAMTPITRDSSSTDLGKSTLDRARSEPPLAPTAAVSPPIAQAAAILPAPRPSAAAAEGPLALVDLPAILVASDLAIRTEIAQPWRASGLHGYVAAGPVKFAGTGACRTVAVWIEARGVPGKSASTSHCLTANGKWERSRSLGQGDILELGNPLGDHAS